MSRSRAVVGEVAASVYAVVVLGVTIAPALLLLLAAERGGTARSLQELDLVTASVVVALPYAVLARHRLRRQSTATRSRTDVWLAAVQGLLVLSLAASLIPGLMLSLTRSSQDAFADHEAPLYLLWGGAQLTAVGLAELAERAAFRWLVAERRGLPRTRA